MTFSSNNSNPLPLQQSKIVPIILAGGIGSRLWPLSRENHPKPFIRLDNQSLIQKTYLRAVSIAGVTEVVTVTNRDLFFYTKDEYNEVQAESVSHAFILEPFGRNSAAAIALAGQYVKEKHGNDAILLILPADQLIDKPDAFKKAVDQAVTLALEGKLLTFGIKPDSPNTGYGYIEAENNSVRRFIEKPHLEQAKEYLAAGHYFWNSGMFCMRTHDILDEMDLHCPAISSGSHHCIKNAKISKGENWIQIEIQGQDFNKIEDISIDYAIFEKSNKVAVVPCDIGWSDIGSWSEFGQLYPSDKDGNHILGETALEAVQNCIIHSEERLVAGIGLNNIIIADTSDAVLVADRRYVQDVRKIVKQLKNREHKSYKHFPTVHRPWGTYTILQEGDGFKLKRIEVKPGAALSLQSHQHRSEHWIVVEGIAKITNGDQITMLEHNQSTYIPVGNKHRLENPGNDLLVLIEVQCGTYLGEDDIVRYEDKYKRIERAEDNTCLA